MIVIHLADRDRLGHLDHRSSAVRDGCEEISETLLERQSVGDNEVCRFEDGPVGEGGLERVGVGAGGNHRRDIESTERRGSHVCPDGGGPNHLDLGGRA